MGASAVWTLLFGVVLVVSSPVPRPNSAYDARLSSLELAIIKSIVETVPGVSKGGGGAFDWSVVQSRSKQLEGAEVEVVQVKERDPDFTGRSGQGDGYPDDWNIVRSVSSQLEAKENSGGNSQYAGSEGASDDWNIVRSISTELHLDAEQAPEDMGSDLPFQIPQGHTGRDNAGQVPEDMGSELPFQLPQGQTGRDDVGQTSGDMGSDPSFNLRQGQSGRDDLNAVVFSGSQGVSGDEESERGTLDDPIDVRLSDHQNSFSQPDGFAARMSEHRSGEQNNQGGDAGFEIGRSRSSDEVTSSGSRQTVSTSGTQAARGDTDSYDLVQPLSTQLQPADNEAGEIPASLTELVPPSDHQMGSWNSPSSSDEQPSEVNLPETPSTETQKPCETGYMRVKNTCQKVHTFQLKSQFG